MIDGIGVYSGIRYTPELIEKILKDKITFVTLNGESRIHNVIGLVKNIDTITADNILTLSCDIETVVDLSMETRELKLCMLYKHADNIPKSELEISDIKIFVYITDNRTQ